MYFILSLQGLFQYCLLLRLFQKIILRGVGPQALFCPVGGGCFVDNVSKGVGDLSDHPVQWVGGGD